MNGSAALGLGALPVWVLVVGGVLAVAQLSFQVYALIDMLRRPADQLALGGRKWLWAIIILLVNWIGAILYFAIGRVAPAAPEVTREAHDAEATSSALDSLYGASKDDGPR